MRAKKRKLPLVRYVLQYRNHKNVDAKTVFFSPESEFFPTEFELVWRIFSEGFILKSIKQGIKSSDQCGFRKGET
jgi:hypothetical protein